MSQLLEAGLNVTAIGMGVVFVLLTMLVGIIHVMSALCQRFGDASPVAPAPTYSAGTTHANEELIGVIAAAIAAYRKRR